MMFRILSAFLALVSTCATYSNASTLIESWEGTSIDGLDYHLGGAWKFSDKPRRAISVSYSNKHVTDGKYSLAITTPGGWSQVIFYDENDLYHPRLPALSEFLSDKLTIDLDIYTDDNMDWSKIEIALQGNALKWTQLSTNALSAGPTRVKYIIPPKASAALKECTKWFQLIIIINSNSPGTVYIDNLCAE